MNPVIIGSIIWLIIGIIVGWQVMKYVGKQSAEGK